MARLVYPIDVEKWKTPWVFPRMFSNELIRTTGPPGFRPGATREWPHRPPGGRLLVGATDLIWIPSGYVKIAIEHGHL